MIFEESINIPQKPERALRYAADFNHLPEWDPCIIGVQQTATGPLGVGVTYDVELRFLGLNSALPYVVQEWQPGRRAVLVGRGTGVVATDTVEVAPIPRGTRLSWRAEIVFPWPISWLDPVLRVLFASNVHRAIANLERCLAQLDKQPDEPPVATTQIG